MSQSLSLPVQFPRDDDGYTRDGYIAEVPLLHGALRFKYRPFYPLERARFLDESKKLTERVEESSVVACSRKLAMHITEWSLEDKPTQDAIIRLHPLILGRLSSIVIYGTEGGDVDPAANGSKELDSDFVLPPDDSVEANQKNSSTP